jgi:signal transduction histidine kinase
LSTAGYFTIAAVYFVAIVNSGGKAPLHVYIIYTCLMGAFALLQTPRFTPERLPLGRRRIVLAAGVAIATIVLFVDPAYYNGVLFCILVAQISLVLSRREALIWTLVCIVLTAIPLFLLTPPELAIPNTLIFVGAYLFFAVVSTTFQREQIARQRSEQLLRELEAAHAQLREYAERVGELAVAEERTRLARELHDSLGHHLTLLSVQLRAASKLILLDPAHGAGEVEKARAVVAEALQDVRQSVSTLRAMAGGQLQPVEALPRLIQEFRDATGIMVNYQADESLRAIALSPAQAVTLYRVVQEGLTNVQKHAHAGRVDISVEQLPRVLRVRIADNGVGNQKAGDSQPGFGLMGLRERVERLGGSMTQGSHDAVGFELCVELPVMRETGDEKWMMSEY